MMYEYPETDGSENLGNLVPLNVKEYLCRSLFLYIP